MAGRSLRALCVVLVLSLTAAAPASAQINDQLSAYTGDNAEGYLQPLADAFGATLNDAFFYSARIPRAGLKISLEFPVMGVIFDDADRVFSATTEGGFSPTSTADAPTVIGSGEATIIPGSGGTSFAFPGGLDLNSFGIVVPQLRVGGVMGTEALVRWIGLNTGDAEIGDITLFGLGVRHSISQYFEALPVELAAGLMWQNFSVGENDAGDDLLSTNAFMFGVQASKPISLGLLGFEPYAGLSVDTFSLNVKYESDVGGETTSIDLDLDTDTTVDLTLGAGFNLVVGHVYGEYSIAGQNSFSFGLALGNLGF